MSSLNSLFEMEYRHTDRGMVGYLDAENDYDLCRNMGQYEVIFDYAGERYYCYIDAVSMDEALGNFFRHHKYLCYSELVDHTEV